MLVERHLITDNGCIGRRIGLTDDLKDLHNDFAGQNALRGMGYDEDDVVALTIPLFKGSLG